MDTIYALSSGSVPSGVAVIRISGPQSRFAIETFCGNVPEARRAVLRRICNPGDRSVIDDGLCLWFPAPGSFTGEDCAELQVHGGPAVVRALLNALGSMGGFRLADPGEFSRRAFANGRIDLTEAEGLADLIAAQTETQRCQALAQSSGRLRRRLEDWRGRILRLRALVEAGFDFADEDDVPDDVGAGVAGDAAALAVEIRTVLDDDRRGEIVRDGFQVMLMGPPNAGKSSLLNALAGRDVAIVTEEPGTTRDLIEVNLDLDGHAVMVVDTAGIREQAGRIEAEGIRRAIQRAAHADLVLWLDPTATDVPPATGVETWAIRSKDDAGIFGADGESVVAPGGLDALVRRLAKAAGSAMGPGEPALVTRERHRKELERCAGSLERAGSATEGPEVHAEDLRMAGDAIGRLTGQIGAEDLLDVIFREFCIGK